MKQRKFDVRLQALRRLLSTTSQFSLSDIPIQQIVCEKFMSRLHRERDFYGDHDGVLWTGTFIDGSKVMVVRAKENTPFSTMIADMRQWRTWVYYYDGHGTITCTEPNGAVSEFTGDPGGNPEALLRHLRSWNMLGQRVKIERSALRRLAA